MSDRADAIGNRTLYIVLVNFPKYTDLLTREWPICTSPEAALTLVQDAGEDAALVFACTYDCPRRDVSEDIARMWCEQIRKGGFDPDMDIIPSFISRHMTDSEVDAIVLAER